ncbi:TraB/GumN family protein [Candidatus Woesearchaeota archaeon]|nr:TraB/GumN family protein [Candidatus Woesearchaeota archaeon]
MPLKIIGTSHIAKQSVKEIAEAMDSFNPEIIAVELDRDRALALMQNQRNKVSMAEILRIGAKGYIFAKIGQFVQQKLGKMVGMAPGSDMKTALELARKNNLKTALIDQPIRITLKNFSRNLTWKEKGRFVGDLIKSLVMPKKQLEQFSLENFDLRKVPRAELIETMMNSLKQRYPSIYKSLVEDRNRYMVRKLVGLAKENPEAKILAVVGAGHKKGMEELFNQFDVL